MNLKGYMRQVLVENLLESWEGKTFHDVFFPDIKKLNKIPTEFRQVTLGKFLNVYCSENALCNMYEIKNNINFRFTITAYNQVNYYLTIKTFMVGYTNEILTDLDITDMVTKQGDLI